MAQPSLSDRISDFYDSLSEVKAESHPSAEIIATYNALTDAAKAELPDDPIIATLERSNQLGADSSMDAGSMRLALQQVLSALGEISSAIG